MSEGVQSSKNNMSGRGGGMRGRGKSRGNVSHDERSGVSKGHKDSKSQGQSDLPPGNGSVSSQEQKDGKGLAESSRGPLGKHDLPSSKDQPECIPASKNKRPNEANVIGQVDNGSSNGSGPTAANILTDNIWSTRKESKKRVDPSQRDGGRFGESQRANGWQDKPQYQDSSKAGTPQHGLGSQSTNSRTDSSNVHKAPIDQQFKSHARQNLLKRLMPVQHVSLDGKPSQDVIANLEKAGLAVPSTNLDEVIEKSKNFWDEFPSETARLHVLLKSGVDGRKLEDFVHSVYPIVHHTCLQLICDFLDHKRRYGTDVERTVYAGMDVVTFIDRLLKKRPMSFLGQDDRYYLPPTSFKAGFGGFEAIGTANQKDPLVLENFLSYDEMRVSALLSLSSWSWFVNDGRRKNFGEKDPEHKYQNEGVIVGQVGARLRKEGVMEYVDCVVTRHQNRPGSGFGDSNASHINAVWGKFWGGQLPTFQDAISCLQVQQAGQRASPFEYLAVGKDNIFNITVFKKRIAITAEILLCEANTRARAYGKKAYVHVVGLGLGVWRAFEEQDELFVEAWGDALRNISDLSHIAFVDFSFINSYSVHGTKNNGKFPGTDVVIRFSKRNLHDKVPEDCILVCNYAWDGNSLPGNEFWMGKLCSTGDSAAACSSCVAEIHTHYINPVVCGAAVRIATNEGQLLDVSDYLKKIKGGDLNVSELNRYGVKLPCSAPTVPKPAVNSTNSLSNTVRFSDGERQVAPAPEPGPSSNGGAWGRTEGTPSSANNAEESNVDESSAPARSLPPPNDVLHGRQMSSSVDGIEVPNDVEGSNAISDATAAPAAAVTAADREPPVVLVKEIPKEIPHASIPGLMIPNPEYEKQQKELNKAAKKNKRKQKNEQKELQEQAKEAQNKSNASNKKSKKKKGKN